MIAITDETVLREHIALVDAHYDRLVMQEGLYGEAMFGFKKPNRISRKLDRLHKKAIRMARQEVQNA